MGSDPKRKEDRGKNGPAGIQPAMKGPVRLNLMHFTFEKPGVGKRAAAVQGHAAREDQASVGAGRCSF